ncbi:MAG: SPOR domain-containing protein [Steroidobacteraceae bacterium]
MDVRIRERLVGALVLVAVIVLLVPAVLRGPSTARVDSAAAPTKSVEIDLGGRAAPAGNDGLVPEPEIAEAKPVAPPAAAPPLAASPPLPADTTTAASKMPRAAATVTRTQPLATGPTAWAVQLGAFSSRAKAEELVTKLRARGYAAFLLEYRAGGQLLHRVRVGPEQDRERAVAIADRLRKDGYQPVVAPHP